MGKVKVSASTNPPPQEQMMDYIKELNKYKIDWLHCDVMDGDFVPAKTYNYETIAKFKKDSFFPLDVHLMMKNPQDYIEKYAEAGANYITVHYEAFNSEEDLIDCLEKIIELGVLAGVAINPDTPIDKLGDLVLPYCDLILIMSVHPGKSGQRFIESTFERVTQLNKLLKKMNLRKYTLIEIDGGVNADNVKALADAGADVVVVGNHLYTATDKAECIKKLQSDK